MRKSLLASALLTVLLASSPVIAGTPPSSELVAAADAGQPAAMLELGKTYINSRQDLARGLALLERTAELGGAEAAYANTALGQYYGAIPGEGARNQAMRYLRRAAALGDTNAQVALAKRLTQSAVAGAAGEPVRQQAIVLLKHAATHNNRDAQWELGIAYYYGRGVEPDAAQGRQWLGKAAENGHAEAAFVLGGEALRNRAAPAYNPQQARRFLELAANAGNRQAMGMLADAYASGEHWARDLTLAMQWARRGDAAGDTTAQARIARIETAQESAREAQRRAFMAEVPDNHSQHTVATLATTYAQPPERSSLDEMPMLSGSPQERVDTLYAFSQELLAENRRLRKGAERIAQLEQQLAKAMERVDRLDRRVADAPQEAPAAPSTSGNAEALNQQGLAAFAAGDFRRAIRMFATAQREGSVDAANNLGMIYLQGQGTTRDTQRAIELFRMAADAGHATAANNLGYLYANGIGVAQDSNRAMAWYARGRQVSPAIQPADVRVQRRIAAADFDPYF